MPHENEILNVWIPWLAIMAGVALVLLVLHWLVRRTSSLVLKFLGINAFLGAFLYGTYVLSRPGDPLARHPIFCNGLLALLLGALSLRHLMREYVLVPRSRKRGWLKHELVRRDKVNGDLADVLKGFDHVPVDPNALGELRKDSLV